MMGLLEVTWWELISLLGLVQSVWLLVYMALRSGRLRNASLAIACFTCLGLAFFADMGTRYLSGLEGYALIQDMLWYALPLCFVLLAMQIAKVDSLPEAKYFSILSLLPLTVIIGWGLGSFQDTCGFMLLCDVEQRRVVLGITASVLGAFSLLFLWGQRVLLNDLSKEKSYKADRYWLILALIIMNCGLIGVTLLFVSGVVNVPDFLIIRNLLGCGLVYVASTSLFRIYPQIIKVAAKSSSDISDEDAVFIRRLADLIDLQKVYQEQGFSRASLARELGASEGTVTRLVKVHFGKSVPQLLNEKRINDACLLLKQTTAPVSVVSEQVGFNSVASFNRVFKEIIGLSPSEYREC